LSLPRAYGPGVLSARFRVFAEDFRVDELPAFEAAGSGEHLLLEIEKRGLNTAAVAQRLAKWAGIGEVGIGYAGMKDRHAVTRQRFTVHLPGREAPDFANLAFEDAGTGQALRVLASARHNRKLPRGALAGNAFTLVLREVDGNDEAIDRKLAAIAAGGLPSYFGEQRFGRAGDNVDSARRMFAGKRVDREQRSILLSAARSEIFNAALAERVRRGDWATGVAGDVWMLEGTHSVFGPEADPGALAERVAALDIHPTGPLWGCGATRASGEAAAIEQGIAAAHADLCAGLEKAGLKQERRALRIRVADLAWEHGPDATLRLRFALPAGAYATGLLAELGIVS
jgi:tRNA pseudouridine13 synthase